METMTNQTPEQFVDLDVYELGYALLLNGYTPADMARLTGRPYSNCWRYMHGKQAKKMQEQGKRTDLDREQVAEIAHKWGHRERLSLVS